jgi:hypothetical protein
MSTNRCARPWWWITSRKKRRRPVTSASCAGSAVYFSETIWDRRSPLRRQEIAFPQSLIDVLNRVLAWPRSRGWPRSAPKMGRPEHRLTVVFAGSRKTCELMRLISDYADACRSCPATRGRVRTRRRPMVRGQKKARRFCVLAKQVSVVVFHRCIGIGTPLLPATNENFDFGITCQFQSKSLDRGSTTGLSVTNCCFIR